MLAFALTLAAQDAYADNDAAIDLSALGAETAYDIGRDAPDTEFARFDLDAAPWVAGAVEALASGRDDNAAARRVALLAGADNQTYLAIAWHGDNGGVAEVHAVDASQTGQPRLRLVRTIRDSGVFLSSPSGTRPFPDLPPVLAIETHCLCSGGRHGLRLILLTGDTQDITPDWGGAVIAIRDLDDDGIAEVIARDESWQGQPTFCGDCPPYLPVVLRWQEGAFAFACTDFAGAFDEEIAVLPQPDTRFEGTDFNRMTDDLRVLIAVATMRAQAGEFAQAQVASAELVEAAETLYAAYASKWHADIPDEAHEIATAIQLAASGFRGAGCPLSEVSPFLAHRSPRQQ